MKDFKWNRVHDHIGPFWDFEEHTEIIKQETRSDASVIRNPAGYNTQLALEALCRVVAELIEIEEGMGRG